MIPSKTIADIPSELPSPPLKWAGGKRWLVPALRKIFDKHQEKRLVEPFVGGMAVALGINPMQALLNDSNPHLINFYLNLKNGLSCKSKMENDQELFYKYRDRFNTLIHDGNAITQEGAELFYFLNRTCFNGLCRFNNKGEFNVPFGRYKKINYVTDFSIYRQSLSQWQFSCSDFESLSVTSDDFLYVDPPYDVEFTKYAKNDFRWEDQRRLVAWLSTQTCPVVVSNQATDRVLTLYSDSGFTIQKVPAPRRISCTGNREPAMEMLATKNL